MFTIAQRDDTQIGQFMLESLPRLVSNFEFIVNNPDIKIHFGFSSKHTNSSEYIDRLRQLTAYRVLKWLGLESRVITGDLAAAVVYMPREGACQDPAYNAHELTAMRSTLVELAWRQYDSLADIFHKRGIHISQ